MRLYNITVLVSNEPERTSYLEVIACVQPFVASLCLRNVLFTHFPRLLQTNRLRNIIEYLLLIVPFGIISFEDIFPDWEYLWTIFYYGFLTSLIYFTKLCHTRYLSWRPSSQASPRVLPQHFHDSTEMISATSDRTADSRQYRAIVYIATVLCILGRDLNNFRLLFAKSYVFGTALMDVGVGCFVVSMGMSGPTTRQRQSPDRLNKRVTMKKTLNLFTILMVIGIIKLLATLSSSSPPAVEEYGVHWNVFLTLAMIKLLGTILEITLCSLVHPLPVAFLINVGYEMVLESWLKIYIVKAERTNWISKNREGLAQLFGLLTLYLWGVFIGRYIFNTGGERINRRKCTVFLFSISTITFLCGNVATHFVLLERESRRIANFSYTLWMVTYTTFLLGETCLIGFLSEKMWNNLRISDFTGKTFLTAIDRHGFTYFLVANLLTGVVNFAIGKGIPMSHESMSGYKSLFVLISYGSATAFISTRLPPIQSLLNFTTRWFPFKTTNRNLVLLDDEKRRQTP